MTVKIRLARRGCTNRQHYHIVVAQDRARRDGRNIEKLGYYSPQLLDGNEKRLVFNTERAKYWLGVGAKPTGRVRKFLERAGVLETIECNNPNKAKPGKKAVERQNEIEKKLIADKEAKEKAKSTESEPVAG